MSSSYQYKFDKKKEFKLSLLPPYNSTKSKKAKPSTKSSVPSALLPLISRFQLYRWVDNSPYWLIQELKKLKCLFIYSVQACLELTIFNLTD